MASPKTKMKIELQPTTLPHVFLCDVDDSGLLKEILLVKQFADGSIYYVDINSLHNIDKSRIKKIVTSQHATKYDCWELLSQSTLSNGVNALDFFHSNNIKSKRPAGALASHSGSLADVTAYGSDSVIGSGFTNTSEAQLDSNSVFKTLS